MKTSKDRYAFLENSPNKSEEDLYKDIDERERDEETFHDIDHLQDALQDGSSNGNDDHNDGSGIDTVPLHFPNGHSAPNRVLSYVDGTAVLVGIMIGSGVFSSPGLALERAGSSGEMMLAWCVSGMLVFFCSSCYIELGGMMPSAGGDFDYLTRAFGDRAAFAFAWYNFFIGKSGSQAIIATIFGIN